MDSAHPTLEAAEAAARERWFAIDEEQARVILDAAGRLTDGELLDRPLLLTGAVIASHLTTERSAGAEDDRARLLEHYSAVAEASASRAHQDDHRWMLIRMIAARWKGDLGQAHTLSERLARPAQATSIRSTLFDDGDEGHRPGQVPLQRGLTTLLAGRTGAAMELFAEAYRAGGPPPYRHFASVNGAANAAMLAAIDGHDEAARKWLVRVGDPELVPGWCRTLITLGATIASTVLAIDELDLEAAAPLAQRLESAGDRFELWPFQLSALTAHDLARDEAVTAYQRFTEIGFERDLTIATEAIADHIVFRAYLDTLIAGGEGGLVLRLAEDVGTPLRALVPIARTRLLAGDDVGAARVAARAMRRVLIPKRDMWEATVIHAVARMRQGETDAALRSFGLVLSGAPRCLPAILGRQHTRDVEDLYQLAGLEPPALAQHAEPLPSEVVTLTAREQRVLQHLVDGLTPAGIAAHDVTSEHTVRTHIKRIYRKLGVSSRSDAVAWANQQGLVRWHHQDGRRDAQI